MRRLIYTALFAIGSLTLQAQYVSEVWVADRGDGTYRNPIIHPSRVEAKNSALLSSHDGYLLELTGWTKGSQAS